MTSRQTERDRVVYGQIWRSEGVRRPSTTGAQMIDTLASRGSEPRAWLADLGCGPGRHALYAAGRGLRVTALDHHETALSTLRAESERLSLDVRLGDAFDWLAEQAAHVLDGIVCFDAVHHASDRPEVVEDIVGLMGSRLAGGGFLLVTLLCDIRYSTGERPSGRLFLSTDEGAGLLDRSLPGWVPVKEKRKPFSVPSTSSVSQETGAVVPASYSAERLLRLYRSE